jgi:hypothetical protein
MNNEDLQQLKALALTATNEAWEFDQAFTPIRIAGGEVVGDDPLPYGEVNTKALYQTPDGEECLVIVSEVGEANGRFIAAANPAAILSLIEHIESISSPIAALKLARANLDISMNGNDFRKLADQIDAALAGAGVRP